MNLDDLAPLELESSRKRAENQAALFVLHRSVSKDYRRDVPGTEKSRACCKQMHITCSKLTCRGSYDSLHCRFD